MYMRSHKYGSAQVVYFYVCADACIYMLYILAMYIDVDPYLQYTFAVRRPVSRLHTSANHRWQNR